MPRLTSRRASDVEDDEGYFISMSDMLTGLLFIFIILLLYFAQTFQKTTQELKGANEARTKLLKEIELEMKNANFTAKAYPAEGLIRLESVAMFKENESILQDNGINAVDKLAKILVKVLPCYSNVKLRSRLQPCPPSKHSGQFIDTMLVEGHTDDQKRPGIDGRDTNIDLSTNRAIATFERLRMLDDHLIDEFVNRIKVSQVSVIEYPIISVSGYGSSRPRPDSQSKSKDDRSRNRRVDIRFLMVTPGTPPSQASAAK